jgi:Skp family chaperone for outer membrane proteins
MTVKRTVIDIILLLLFCVTRITDASAYINSAFVSHNSIVVRRETAAYAAPGMSDERRKQERDAEIRSKIAKLKREGKMKNKDGTRSGEDSAMFEAEAFFNRTSPVRKFERKLAERKRLASLAEEDEADEQGKRINDQ